MKIIIILVFISIITYSLANYIRSQIYDFGTNELNPLYGHFRPFTSYHSNHYSEDESPITVDIDFDIK